MVLTLEDRGHHLRLHSSCCFQKILELKTCPSICPLHLEIVTGRFVHGGYLPLRSDGPMMAPLPAMVLDIYKLHRLAFEVPPGCPYLAFRDRLSLSKRGHCRFGDGKREFHSRYSMKLDAAVVNKF